MMLFLPFFHPKDKLEDKIIDSQHHGYLHHEVHPRGGPMIANWEENRGGGIGARGSEEGLRRFRVPQIVTSGTESS